MSPNKLISLARAGYAVLIASASHLQSPLVLLVRLYWGWSFFQTGKGKLLNHAQVTEFFTSLHLPLPGLNAWMAGTTECLGGLLLLVGLASRLAAIPLIVTMVVAYLTADLDKVLGIFSEPDKFTSADPFLFLFAAVIVLVLGPGAFSLDRLIELKYGFKSEPTNQSDSAERLAPKSFVHQNAQAPLR
jgi:putative oxidoreductase